MLQLMAITQIFYFIYTYFHITRIIVICRYKSDTQIWKIEKNKI